MSLSGKVSAALFLAWCLMINVCLCVHTYSYSAVVLEMENSGNCIISQVDRELTGLDTFKNFV